MKKKKIFFLSLIGITLCLLGIGISYAMWKISYQQKDINALGTKCFEVSLENATEGLSLTSAYPMSDEAGLSQIGYTFTIKNKCDDATYYQIHLESLEIEGKKISDQYIKVAVNDVVGYTLNNYEPVLPTVANAENSYKILSGVLGSSESANSEVTYTFKIWMDEETPALSEVMNATFKSKITVTSTYIGDINSPVQITNFSYLNGSSSGISKNTFYDGSNIKSKVSLPNSDSSVTYNLNVLNTSSDEYGILKIMNLPENITYEFSNYVTGEKLCDVNNQCTNGMLKPMQITFKYKNDGYDSNNTEYNLDLNLDFRTFHTLAFTDISDNSYPKYIIDGGELNITLPDILKDDILIFKDIVDLVNDEDYYPLEVDLEYTYDESTNILTVPNTSNNLTIIHDPKIHYYYQEGVIYQDEEYTQASSYENVTELLANHNQSIVLHMNSTYELTEDEEWSYYSYYSLNLKRNSSLTSSEILNIPKNNTIDYGRGMIIDGDEISSSTPCVRLTGTLNMKKGLIRNCNSTDSGGGMLINSGANFNMSGGMFRNNYSEEHGGAIYASGATINISDNAKIKDNKVKVLTSINELGWGGGIAMVNGTLTMNGGSFDGNEGRIGGALYANNVTLNFENALFKNNTALGYDGSGGGIYMIGTTPLTLKNSQIINNKSQTNGGGIFPDGASCTINVSGKILVSGNQGNYDDSAEGASNNIYLPVRGGSLVKVTVAGTLEGSDMSITDANVKYNGAAPGDFTKNYGTYNLGIDPNNYFKSDLSEYGITLNTSTNEVRYIAK